MPENYLALAKQRRTIYALGKDLPLPEDDVVQTIQDAINAADDALYHAKKSGRDRVMTAASTHIPPTSAESA